MQPCNAPHPGNPQQQTLRHVLLHYPVQLSLLHILFPVHAPQHLGQFLRPVGLH